MDNKKILKKEYDKKRYQEKKEAIREYQKKIHNMPIECECGITVLNINYKKHKENSKHKKNMEKINNEKSFKESLIKMEEAKKLFNL